jgi:hypothetical protein
VSAGAGWIITHDCGAASDELEDVIHQGNAAIGFNQTALDAEVAIVERAIKRLAGNHEVGLQHVTVHSGFTSAIARCQHVGLVLGELG